VKTLVVGGILAVVLGGVVIGCGGPCERVSKESTKQKSLLAYGCNSLLNLRLRS
jgi:hypothetical protein